MQFSELLLTFKVHLELDWDCLSLSIIESHNGNMKIWGKNNADGTGTTVTFILPLDK